jgi:asparagine synthase (glutamine-hydrolysing)
MCGICGIYDRASSVERQIIKVMADTIVHRGPDDEGYFLEGGLGLGMRRLSIIDLHSGKQPIFNEDCSAVVVFNGEIYNFVEVREQLIKKGHLFKTLSDTEVIVHLYEEFGLDFPLYLRGMFAIALFDRSRKRLILVRDRLGKKPLFYAQCGTRLIFGSEIKPILTAAPELRKANDRSIQPFFRFGFIPEPETAYQNIFQLPPGCLMDYDGEIIHLKKYWDMDFPPRNPSDPQPSTASYRQELDRLLEEAVRIRLISDVPLGAFLSGGLDSSLVVAYMSRLMSQPVKTFTIAFDEQSFDESIDAQRVADYCHTDHHVLTLRVNELRRDFFETIDEIIRHTDEPFGDSSAFPTYFVSRIAREHVKVILAGDGADEIFGGYTLFQGLRFAKLYSRIPAWIRNNLIAPGLNLGVNLVSPGPQRWKALAWQKRISDSNLPLIEMLASKFSITPPAILDRLIPGAPLVLDQDERSGVHWIVLGNSRDSFLQTQYADTRFFQVNDMLVKVDRMSMAHSLEVRNPYLDHHVVGFAASLPTNLKLRGWTTKAILRDIASRYLPAETVNKKKHGFGIPFPFWMRQTLWEEIRNILMSNDSIYSSIDRATVEKVLIAHKQGEFDYSRLIWCLLAFESWHRQYL